MKTKYKTSKNDLSPQQRAWVTRRKNAKAPRKARAAKQAVAA